jgi:hypothetical protein
MPRLGPDFLHQPLPALPAISLEEAPGWLMRGLSYFAPAGLRRRWWRALYQLARADGEGGTTLVEEAWSGERRLSPATANQALPVAVALPSTATFETRADLPSAAIRSLREAISLQLETLSPIAPEDVVFDVGEPEGANGDRILVPVAIARKEDVRRLEERFSGRRLYAIGAAPDGDGSLKYVFKRFPESAGSPNRLVLAGGAIFLAMLVLAYGAAARLDKEIAALQSYEDALVTAMREHKELSHWLPAAGLERIGVSGEDAVRAITTLIEALPGGVRLISADLEGAAWTIEGYAPDSTAWPDHLSPTFSASDRPGFRRFHAVIALSGGA